MGEQGAKIILFVICLLLTGLILYSINLPMQCVAHEG